MRSTGEDGHDKDFTKAYAKAQIAAGQRLPTSLQGVYPPFATQTSPQWWRLPSSSLTWVLPLWRTPVVALPRRSRRLALTLRSPPKFTRVAPAHWRHAA